MRQRILIGSSILASLLMIACPAPAQVPGGVQVPGAGSMPSMPSMPTLPSKTALLDQAKAMVSDLTSLKSSGKLAPAQVQQVDGLLPKATALQNDLQKPQIPTSKLTEYANTLKELQQQITALKSLIK